MYICICMYIQLYIYVHSLCLYTYRHICIFTYLRIQCLYVISEVRTDLFVHTSDVTCKHCIYLYLNIHICLYTCIYIYIYIYIYVYIHISVYVNIYIYVYTYTFMFICIYIPIYTHIYTYIHIYVNIDTVLVSDSRCMHKYMNKSKCKNKKQQGLRSGTPHSPEGAQTTHAR